MDFVDFYYKKTIQYKYQGYNLEFMVSQSLFSSQKIDNGTQRLLRTLIFENVNKFNKVLDLGCGYGPIGISLKKICPDSTVHMVDKDALAIEYTKANLKINDIKNNTFVYGGLGYLNIKDNDFDLIVSNIPAKVEKEVLIHIIKDARYYLKNNGKVIIVVIDAISEFINNELVSDDSIETLYHKSWPGHHVYHYTFKNNIDTVQKDSINKNIFNSTHNTKLISKSNILSLNLVQITNKIDTAVFFNLGNGDIILSLVKGIDIKNIFIVDKDLEQLNTSKDRLIKNGYSDKSIKIYHQVGIEIENVNVDAIFLILSKQLPDKVYKTLILQSLKLLKKKGYIVFSSKSNIISKIEKFIDKKFFIKLDQVKNNSKESVLFQKIND